MLNYQRVGSEMNLYTVSKLVPFWGFNSKENGQNEFRNPSADHRISLGLASFGNALLTKPSPTSWLPINLRCCTGYRQRSGPNTAQETLGNLI